jgi:hypothetical protein
MTMHAGIMSMTCFILTGEDGVLDERALLSVGTNELPLQSSTDATCIGIIIMEDGASCLYQSESNSLLLRYWKNLNWGERSPLLLNSTVP